MGDEGGWGPLGGAAQDALSASAASGTAGWVVRELGGWGRQGEDRNGGRWTRAPVRGLSGGGGCFGLKRPARILRYVRKGHATVAQLDRASVF